MERGGAGEEGDGNGDDQAQQRGIGGIEAADAHGAGRMAGGLAGRA